MKTLIDHLAQYADYHRDPRNIHTHFVGVPMIMFAVVILLSRPTWMVGAVPVSPALLAALAASAFYFRLDMRFGLAMAALLAAMLVGGQWVAAQTLAVWLATGIGLFAVVILLSRPTWMAGALPLSPALVAALAASVFYFRLDMRFGLAMAALLAAMLVGGPWVAAQTLAV